MLLTAYPGIPGTENGLFQNQRGTIPLDSILIHLSKGLQQILVNELSPLLSAGTWVQPGTGI